MFIGSWLAGEVVLANTLPSGGHDWSVARPQDAKTVR